MAIYNITNLTGNNLLETTKAVIQLEPNYGHAMVFTIGLLAFFGLILRYNFESSFITAGFLVSVLSIFLRPAGIVSTNFLVVSIILTALMAGYSVYTRQKEG